MSRKEKDGSRGVTSHACDGCCLLGYLILAPGSLVDRAVCAVCIVLYNTAQHSTGLYEVPHYALHHIIDTSCSSRPACI